MNLNTKSEIQKKYTSHFYLKGKEEDIVLDAKLIMYRFLSEVEKISEQKGLNRKQLAELIGTSPSFITQLFRGNKLLNLETAAKFQRALNIRFDISASSLKKVKTSSTFSEVKRPAISTSIEISKLKMRAAGQ